MPLRPVDVLALTQDYFSGGAHLAEAQDGGLMSVLLALSGRAATESVSATRALTALDEGLVLEVDPGGGTVDIQLPTGLPVGFFVQVRQVTTGTVRIVAAGSTINAVASATVPLSIAEQWGAATVEVRATDTWLVTGQLA